MKKVCCLIPCLMRDNNRKANIKYITENIERMNADKYIIYAQCFNASDYATLEHSKVEFIGRKDEPQGFVKPRNELLEYFYNSDYDYAVWIDANASITSTTLNSYLTVLDALRSEKIDVDAIFSSLGIIASSERIHLATQDDYFDVVKLLPASRYSIRNCPWLHSCFIKNFNLYYKEKIFIDESCDPWKGTSEDTYLSTLLRQCGRCYLCPSICVSKPPAKTSTWMHNSVDENGKATYGYPPIDWDTIQETVVKALRDIKIRNLSSSIIEIDRVDEYKSNLQEYKSRKKIPEMTSKINLF